MCFVLTRSILKKKLFFVLIFINYNYLTQPEQRKLTKLFHLACMFLALS